MQTKKLLLIPLTIFLGIFLGYLLHKNEKETVPQIYNAYPNKQTVHVKNLHTPKYLSEQFINIKTDYIESRPEPKNREEEIVAYYEDTSYNEFDKNPELYEENGTVYLNLEGQPKAIASNGEQYDGVMLPKLSASKKHVVYQLCDDEHDGCVVIVEELETHKKKVLDDAVSYAWHPQRELLIYDGAQKDDGHAILESELFLYSPYENIITTLTDTKDFVETQPIFSEDGITIYCADEKTGKLLYFNLFATIHVESLIKDIKFYKTADNSLDSASIKQHANKFKTIEKDEKFAEKNMNYWIEVELSKTMEKGIYFTQTFPYVFDKTSFTAEQLEIKKSPKMLAPFASSQNEYALMFNYDPKTDERRYYFHISSYIVSPPFATNFMKVTEVNERLQELKEQRRSYYYSEKSLKETILSSMVIGMILMSALYTAVLFFRRRDENGERQKAFIYYTLMQVSMAFFLLTAPVFFRSVFSVDFLSMGALSLVVAFFSTLFTQAFLETKKHLPIIHTLLNAYLVFIIADLIWIFEPILMNYALYEFFGLLFLVTAVLRVKDGFKPAWFYLFGWIGLLTTIFLMDFFHMSNFLMFIGVFIEAVMLAWGLVFHAEGESTVKTYI